MSGSSTARTRYHSKSRNGCIRCKARRVKCDETRPVCERCKRSQRECCYEDKPASSLPYQLRRHPVKNQADLGHFDALDMLLMHHYITFTAQELVGPMEAQDIWRHVIPRQAYDHPILMHGILSLARADLARRHYTSSGITLPESDSTTARQLCTKYRARALSHQHVGLGLFQKSLASRLDLSQCDVSPLILFNILLIIATFALPLTDDEGLSMDDLLSLFAICRGGREVFSYLQDPCMRRSLKTMMFAEDLSLLPDDPPVSADADTNHGSKRHSTQQETFGRLIDYQQLCQDSVLDIRTVCHWPAMCSSTFVEEVKQLEPDAFIVLAQYSHVLQACKKRWWIGNWAELLLKNIDAALGHRDKARLAWDLEARLLELQSIPTSSPASD